MSLLSFIAFPREVDASYLKSKIDKTKMVKIKEIKGTKWESKYIGVPDEAIVYIGDSIEQEGLQLYEKSPAMSFKKVFDNHFIYSLNAEFKKPDFLIPNINIKDMLGEIEKQDGVCMSEEEYRRQSKEYERLIEQKNARYVERCRKQLYELIKCNTKSDEAVEIFSHWVRTADSIKLSQPKEKRVLMLEDVLSSELMDLHHGRKIIIRNIDK